MTFDDIKKKWSSYSVKKKWCIGGGVAFVLVGLANMGQSDHAGTGNANRSPSDMMQAENGGVPGPAYGFGQPGGAPAENGGYSGGSVPGTDMSHSAMPSQSGSADIIRDEERRQAMMDRLSHDRSLMNRDQNDVQETRTGEIT